MRISLPALALIVCASTASARDVASDVQQLDADLAARIGVVGAPPTKESKNLAKARAKLGTYHGGSTVADFKILASAGRFVAASRTSDDAVTADAQAVLHSICDCATTRQGLADSALTSLLDPLHAAIVQDLIRKADGFLQGAKSSLAKNPTAAAGFAVKAYDLFGYAVGTSNRFVAQEAGSAPPQGIDVVFGTNSVLLSNSASVDYDIEKIRVFAEVTTGGTHVKTYRGTSAKAAIPGLFATRNSNRVFAAFTDMSGAHPSVFDLGTILTQLCATNERIVGQAWITMKGRKFFVVRFDLTGP